MPKLPAGRPPAGAPSITAGAAILANQLLNKNTRPSTGGVPPRGTQDKKGGK